MNRVRHGIGWTVVGAVWALAASAPAVADDTEVFRFTPPPGTRANVLFVIDDSISMGTNLRTPPVYDPTVVYPSEGCDRNRVYWKEGTGNPPTCSTNNWFEASAMKCDKATQRFNTLNVGRYHDDHFAQYDPGSTGRWRDIVATEKTRIVECEDDGGIHGDGGTPKHAINGLSPTAFGTSTNVSWSSRKQATLYSGNYMNWYYGPGEDRTRLDVVQRVVDGLLETMEGVNVGLMDFNPPSGSGGSEGGSVSVAMGPIETNRAAMRTAVANLRDDAYTPLAETLYEARQYFAGGRVTFGTSSTASGATVTGDSSRYDSPIDQACQQNFVVFLTDGEPTYDNAADTDIVNMRDSAGKTMTQLTGSGTCDVETWAGVDFASPPGGFMSHCLDDVAHFMYQGDMSSTLADTQRVRTITVGFTVDLPVLEAAAERGNGRVAGDSEGVYFVANDAVTLASVFDDIVGGIQKTTSSFASPAVAVNAFNRTENLSDLFVSVFKPEEGYHWPGNLKKYRLRDDGAIVDSRNTVAVSPTTGLFVDGTQSYWTPTGVFDGSDVELGGAASIIPAARQVYTNLSGADLNATANRVEIANSAITAAMLGTGASFPARNDVINFINGLNPATLAPRKQMGDPLHAQPVSFIYGPGLRDGLVFVATNDGYLHALHANTGVEQWAFMPREFLDDQIDLLENDDFPTKHYALDGPMRIQMIGDSDGVIETGEKVILYVGMRRGGSVYYALDITNMNDPQLLWRHDETTLVGLGQSWSPPVPTRVKIGSTEYHAVVIGGGYEPDQDNDASTTDTTGNSIYIVNANTGGTVLWRATKTTATGVSQTFSQMDYSFPGEIKVLDMDGDRFVDRMYAADMGGQIWRFDVTKGAAATSLAAGGVIARLGTAGDTTPTLAENRRFYYSPDVAFVNTRTDNFVHIGIGSGHREHPLGTVNSDRFYAIRDTYVANMSQTAFNTAYGGSAVITEAALPRVTTVNHTLGTNDKGWRFDLLPGEKVLAEARTIANTVFFTTFRPGATPASCQPQPGFSRLYRVSLYNGAPVTNLDGGLATEPLSMADMFVENTGSIPSTSQVIFVSRDRDGDGTPDDQDNDDDNDGVLDSADGDADNDGIPDSIDPDDDNDGILDVDEAPGDQGWVCTDRICVPLGFSNVPVRTYWRQTSLD